MSEKLFSEDEIKEFQLDKLSIEDLNEIVKSIPSKTEETLLLKKEEKDYRKRFSAGRQERRIVALFVV